jgi:hypothetical protein
MSSPSTRAEPPTPFFETRRIVGSLRERTVFLPGQSSPRRDESDTIWAVNAMASRVSEYVENKLTMNERFVDEEMMQIEDGMDRTASRAERLTKDIENLSTLIFGQGQHGTDKNQFAPQSQVRSSLW